MPGMSNLLLPKHLLGRAGLELPTIGLTDVWGAVNASLPDNCTFQRPIFRPDGMLSESRGLDALSPCYSNSTISLFVCFAFFASLQLFSSIDSLSNIDNNRFGLFACC